MSIINKINVLLLCTGLWSCNTGSDISENKQEPPKTDSSSTNKEQEALAIKFNEFTLSIGKWVNADVYNLVSFNADTKDTAFIHPQLGVSIEGEELVVSSEQLTDITIEQRCERTLQIDIGEEAPCTLDTLQIFYSPNRKLEKNAAGHFVADKYESFTLPEIDMEELKNKVKSHCGENYYNKISALNSANEAPFSAIIYRYILTVTGKQKNTGQLINKIIIVEMPLSC